MSFLLFISSFLPSNYYKICYLLKLLALFVQVKAHNSAPSHPPTNVINHFVQPKKIFATEDMGKIQCLREEFDGALVVGWACRCVRPWRAARCGRDEGEPAMGAPLPPPHAAEPGLRTVPHPSRAWVVSDAASFWFSPGRLS